MFALLAFVLAACLAARAAADQPLFEQSPFDQITLDENNANAVLKVKPLDLPERRLPAKPDPDSKLVIRLVDQPDKQYEVAWRSIRKVDLFEQMLLGKANELAAANHLDEAYDYYHFLDENYRHTPGLDEAHEAFLFRQAKALFDKQRYRNALGVLRELHRRNPRYARLDAAMGAMTGRLVEQYAAAGDHASLRALLRNLAACYPKHPLVTKWETRLKAEAAACLADAQRARQAGDLHKASTSIRSVVLIWPALDGARELAEAIHKQYPRVVVGVCQAAPADSRRPCNGLQLASDWAARRDSRLLSRSLCELAAAGPQGGRYACACGKVKTDDGGRRLIVALDGNAGISACDLARGLLAMADRANPAYCPEWADVFTAVTAPDARQVDIELAENRQQPQALLDALPLSSVGQVSNLSDVGQVSNLSDVRQTGTPDGRQIENLPHVGPYVRAETTAAETTCVLNPRYFARTPTQPREIVQRSCADAAAGVAALRRGDIQLLDQLDPWQVKPLEAEGDVTVQSYALPRLHCLVPNARKPLTANRTFRRALAYAIDRQAVLEQLLRGDKLPGCVPLGGVMPVGTAQNESLGYASDPDIKPWRYDPRLALALAEGGASRTPLAF